MWYNRKTVVKTDRWVITKAQVITTEEVIKLYNTKLEKTQLAYNKAIAKKETTLAG
jgi:hypothetical protein